MKFTVAKSVLMNSLTPAMGTVSNKNTITSIEGILIETLENGSVNLSSYDMTKGIKATFEPSEIEENGKYIINAQRLYQTVRALPDTDITIEVNAKLNCTITAGKASFSMFATKGEDFPNLPELKADRSFKISSKILKTVIGKVSHSVAVISDNRVMLTGAFFKVKRDKIEVVSCDNYTLSKCEVFCDVDINEEEYSFIIPGHALGEIVKILPDDEEYKCSFYLSRKHAIIVLDDLVFFTRTIDSEYLDYNRIIPKDNSIIAIVDRERFLSGLERANIIAEEKIQGSGRSYVKLKVEEDFMTITSTSVNGRVYDEIDCEHTGNDIEIGFNCRYLINNVKAAEGEKVKVTLKSPTDAITIEPSENIEGFNYFYMVVPLRMTEQ